MACRPRATTAAPSARRGSTERQSSGAVTSRKVGMARNATPSGLSAPEPYLFDAISASPIALTSTAMATSKRPIPCAALVLVLCMGSLLPGPARMPGGSGVDQRVVVRLIGAPWVVGR
jgi:hypothetical protein